MAHTSTEKKQLLARIKRIQGQLRAVEAMLQNEENCYKVLQTLTASRGALNGLVTEIIDGHLENHVVLAQNLKAARTAGQDLRNIVRSFFK
jgi:DNA-binding FrmR family transcriptional regulator